MLQWGMARALPVEIPSGRYHVTARGNERTPVYRNDNEKTHFLKLLFEATGLWIRIDARVH